MKRLRTSLLVLLVTAVLLEVILQALAFGVSTGLVRASGAAPLAATLDDEHAFGWGIGPPRTSRVGPRAG